MAVATAPGHPRVSGHEIVRLWPVAVPGPAGEPVPDDPDTADTWFHAAFRMDRAQAGEEIRLRAGGLATLVDVDLDGTRVIESGSMYATHDVDVTSLVGGDHVLTLRCRALTEALAVRRRPRARWRTRLVRDNDLRWIRTSILGRAPGFAPGPPLVGPWQPIWLERRRLVAVDALRVRTALDGDAGVVRVTVTLRALGPDGISAAELRLGGPNGEHRSAIALRPVRGDDRTVRGEASLRVPDVERWWPHTHGRPSLHDVRLAVTTGDRTVDVEAGRVGFRTLAPGPAAGHDLERDGLSLRVNDVPVFARGAVWTPLPGAVPADAAAADVAERDLEATLQTAREAGMNMLRVPGIGRYESEAFHDRCDALGLLVWQDLAFANLDYPFADPAFADACVAEVRELLERIAGRPSTAVVCGNSEVEQQVAMLGLPPAQWRDPFYAETFPALVREAECDAVVVPSAPFGGDRPFQPDRGVANYYGVGGYRRPLDDVRRAGVRFAAESLAFANVPDDATIERMLPDAPAEVVVHHPVWKAAVPRDNGAGWDFEDVRDHYLRTVLGEDPGELRRVDHARYLERSRAVSGEVMAAVFGEWRRPESPCGGALVLWLRDLVPGAGWGVLDDRGAPKVAYHHLRRALAPTAVWITDEGLAGIAVHVAADGPDPLEADLRVTLYRDGEVRVGEGHAALALPPHGAATFDLETLLGGFVDASWAYRFGPPGHDLIVASLEQHVDDGVVLVAQAFRSLPGRVREPLPAERLGLGGCARWMDDGALDLRVRTRRFADGVRIVAPGFRADDDAFAIEPGHERSVRLRPTDSPWLVEASAATRAASALALTSLDLIGRVPVAVEATR